MEKKIPSCQVKVWFHNHRARYILLTLVPFSMNLDLKRSIGGAFHNHRARYILLTLVHFSMNPDLYRSIGGVFHNHRARYILLTSDFFL